MTARLLAKTAIDQKGFWESAGTDPDKFLDPEKRKRIEAKFGTIRRTEVLYRGKSGTFGGVTYRNVNEYLFSLV